LIRAHTADENSASDMKRVFRVVKSLMEEFNCTFLFIDHEKKPSQFDGSSAQRLRGSSEKAAFIDTLISLRTKDGGLVVEHSKSRYAKPIPRFEIIIEDIGDNVTQVKHLGYLE
jgi:RecA-family ATPase